MKKIDFPWNFYQRTQIWTYFDTQFRPKIDQKPKSWPKKKTKFRQISSYNVVNQKLTILKFRPKMLTNNWLFWHFSLEKPKFWHISTSNFDQILTFLKLWPIKPKFWPTISTKNWLFWHFSLKTENLHIEILKTETLRLKKSNFRQFFDILTYNLKISSQKILKTENFRSFFDKKLIFFIIFFLQEKKSNSNNGDVTLTEGWSSCWTSSGCSWLSTGTAAAE